MAKINRFNGNLVAPASASLGTERTLFGEVTQSDDLTDQFTADLLRGWGIVGPSDQPTLQDFNAMGFTLGQIHAYLHQMGVAEWNIAQEYHLGSISNVAGVLYVSLINTNVGNAPASSPAQWRPADFLDTTRIDVASATTVDLTAAAPNTRHINITGTTTVSGFTVAAGKTYFVRFDAVLTLTNSASLVTQSGANILTAAGDTCVIRATAANVVEIICYTPGIPQAVGYRQTWQDLTGSRLVATNYTNTTGRPITVSVIASHATGVRLLFMVDGVTLGHASSIDSSGTVDFVTLVYVVPAGSVYRAEIQVAGSIVFWGELR